VNSQLYNTNIELPEEVKEYLGTCFDHVGETDPNIEGFKRNKELRDSGFVTFQQLGRIKNWFDSYGGDKTDKPFILNGADYMRNWVDKTMEDLRKNGNLRDDINKEVMPDELNAEELKSLGPIADMIRPSKDHSTFTQDVRIKEDVNRINNLMKKII
jgi:hypothetical protein